MNSLMLDARGNGSHILSQSELIGSMMANPDGLDETL